MSNKQPELSKIIRNVTFNKIISIESAGKPRAKAPTSSAGGLFQFLNGTFYGECAIHYPAILKGRTKEQVYALRFDPETAIEVGVAFTEDNARALGKGWTEGDLYLAHFLGVATAKKVLRAPGSTAVRECVTPAAVAANRTILTNKTCSQVRAWAQNAMDTRWAHLGNVDWIAHFYHKDDSVVLPSPEVVAAHSEQLAHKVEDPDGHLADLDGNGIPDYLERVPSHVVLGHFDEPAQVEEPAAPPADPDAPAPLPGEVAETGDPDVRLCATVLRSMHYNPGKIEGKWGGMFAEAIAGFVNDRHADIDVPRSKAEFDELKVELKHALALAQDDKFVRPVSEERAHATTEKVEEVASEAAPARKGLWVTLTGAISSATYAVYHTVGDWVGDAWSFFTDNEDNIPDEVKSPSVIWEWVQSVPVGLWFVGLAVVFGAAAYMNRNVLKKIREDVKTGMRK